jgi:hypothetical protein
MKRADAEELTARIFDALGRFDLSDGFSESPDLVFAVEHVIEGYEPKPEAPPVEGQRGKTRPKARTHRDRSP